MSRSAIKLAAILLAIGMTAACASGGGSGTPRGGPDQAATPQPPAAEGSVVQILNTAPGSVSVTVYMIPEAAGVDTPLGQVESGQTRTFNFAGQPGRYRIRAVGSSGETASDVFQLYRNSQVRWDMSLGRRVQVTGR